MSGPRLVTTLTLQGGLVASVMPASCAARVLKEPAFRTPLSIRVEPRTPPKRS